MMAMSNDYSGLRQQQSSTGDISPRRAGGTYQQQPTRIKSFFRQNQNNPLRKCLLPLLYVTLAVLYFYNLLFRDVGSGVHVLRDNNINATRSMAPVWNSDGGKAVPLEPRSLADVTIANAEVAWKRQVDHQNFIRRRADMREEQRKKREDAINLAKDQHDVHQGDADAQKQLVKNATEQISFMTDNSTKYTKSGETDEEYVKRLTSLSVKRTPQRRKMGQRGSPAEELGILPVLLMISICTTFRIFVNVLVGRAADLDPGDDNENETDAGGMSNVGGLTFFTGGREAARLRRRARFQRFVDRLNAERQANGERQISADTLRHLVNARDFNGNDYDRLSSFVEENGPAIGSIFSAIGATEAEINRCPSRKLKPNDDLLSLRRTGLPGDEQHQSCSVCLERYQVGETVRTIPCFHTFHKGCIDPWLAQRAECPVCKHSAIG